LAEGKQLLLTFSTKMSACTLASEVDSLARCKGKLK
jgi:hypothetical protein